MGPVRKRCRAVAHSSIEIVRSTEIELVRVIGIQHIDGVTGHGRTHRHRLVVGLIVIIEQPHRR